MNYYVAGAISNQKNGVGLIGGTTANNNQQFNTNVNASVLTSVGSIGPGGTGGSANNGFYGLNGTDKYPYASANAGLILFSQKGKTTTGEDAPISTSVGPKGLTVTLTLVPGSAPSAPANK